MRVQVYTNDREQPIDLNVREIHTRVPEIRTNEPEHVRGRSSTDQTLREVIRNPAGEKEPNLLFTTNNGAQGAIYLNPEKVAAIVTCWTNESYEAEEGA